MYWVGITFKRNPETIYYIIFNHSLSTVIAMNTFSWQGVYCISVTVTVLPVSLMTVAINTFAFNNQIYIYYFGMCALGNHRIDSPQWGCPVASSFHFPNYGLGS